MSLDKCGSSIGLIAKATVGFGMFLYCTSLVALSYVGFDLGNPGLRFSVAIASFGFGAMFGFWTILTETSHKEATDGQS